MEVLFFGSDANRFTLPDGLEGRLSRLSLVDV